MMLELYLPHFYYLTKILLFQHISILSTLLLFLDRAREELGKKEGERRENKNIFLFVSKFFHILMAIFFFFPPGKGVCAVVKYFLKLRGEHRFFFGRPCAGWGYLCVAAGMCGGRGGGTHKGNCQAGSFC